MLVYFLMRELLIDFSIIKLYYPLGFAVSHLLGGTGGSLRSFSVVPHRLCSAVALLSGLADNTEPYEVVPLGRAVPAASS